MITGGDLRQSRLDVGYKTFTISPWGEGTGLFGDYQFTRSLSVNLPFPTLPRRTKKDADSRALTQKLPKVVIDGVLNQQFSSELLCKSAGYYI